MSRIDLGLIDGNFWNAHHVDLIEGAINESSVAGEIKMYVGATAPFGYLMLNGQVVANAQVLYPDLWAVAPAVWKAGAALNLPNMAQRFPMGAPAAPAALGGSNSKTLAEANLPPHAHAGTTGIQNARHTHAPGGYLSGDQFVVQRFPGPHAVFDINDTSTGATIQSYPGTTTEITDGSSDGTHGHPFSTNNGNGSSAPFDITPAYITFNFLIRAY